MSHVNPVHNFMSIYVCFITQNLLPLPEHSILSCTVYLDMGRDSSVGIATRYGLDGPGIESRWGRDFPHPSRPALGPTQPPVQWVPDLSQGKAAGAWCCLPTPSRRRGHQRVELYLYSPSGLQWPVIGWTLPYCISGYCLKRVLYQQVVTDEYGECCSDTSRWKIEYLGIALPTFHRVQHKSHCLCSETFSLELEPG